MTKQYLRQRLQKYLREMGDEQRGRKSRNACRNLVATEQFQKAAAIMMYLSMPCEVDTSEAILSAWQQGKIVAVPRIFWQHKSMLPVEINSLETGFSAETAGLRNPTSGRPVPVEQLDLVVTPALGFDRKGNRLGRGHSYYDRFFANENLRATRCGFAFAEQVVDSIPATERDEPVDLLVTDEEIIYFNKRQGG